MINIDQCNKFDRVYTIGCFDWFHHGHEKLLERLRKYGKQVIVGVHDDNSLIKLKNLKSGEYESFKTRMKNVKKFADVVYVIPHTDPTFFIECDYIEIREII